MEAESVRTKVQEAFASVYASPDLEWKRRSGTEGKNESTDL